jgi:hypothetical protein
MRKQLVAPQNASKDLQNSDCELAKHKLRRQSEKWLPILAQPASSGGGGDAQEGEGGSGQKRKTTPLTEEERKKRRKEINRQSARRIRERKSNEMESLRQQVHL